MTIEASLLSLETAVKELTAAVLAQGSSIAAPKTTRSKAAKPAPSNTAASTATSSEPTSAVTVSASTADAPPPATVEASPTDKVYTDSDVRTALVQAQTRLGGREKPQAILAKYATPATMAGLKQADYAKVIAECASAA